MIDWKKIKVLKESIEFWTRLKESLHEKGIFQRDEDIEKNISLIRHEMALACDLVF